MCHFCADSMQTNEQYHEGYKPPPEGTNTGLGDDQVVPVDDPSNEQQQVQHRCVNNSKCSTGA